MCYLCPALQCKVFHHECPESPSRGPRGTPLSPRAVDAMVRSLLITVFCDLLFLVLSLSSFLSFFIHSLSLSHTLSHTLSLSLSFSFSLSLSLSLFLSLRVLYHGLAEAPQEQQAKWANACSMRMASISSAGARMALQFSLPFKPLYIFRPQRSEQAGRQRLNTSA